MTELFSLCCTERKQLQALLLSFGLLCVLQASLNIILRLSSTTDTGGTEEESLDETLEETLDKTLDETLKDSCPQAWILSSSSCYYISSQRASWDRARLDCRGRGADLVIINSPQEQEFLSGLVVAAWVGMTDRRTEGVWIWVDGTPVDKERLLWAPGQPDGAFGGEDCGEIRVMTSFTGLNDYNCDAQNQWICEKKLKPV